MQTYEDMLDKKDQVIKAMNRRDVDEANRLLDEIDKYFNGSGGE